MAVQSLVSDGSFTWTQEPGSENPTSLPPSDWLGGSAHTRPERLGDVSMGSEVVFALDPCQFKSITVLGFREKLNNKSKRYSLLPDLDWLGFTCSTQVSCTPVKKKNYSDHVTVLITFFFFQTLLSLQRKSIVRLNDYCWFG